MFRLIRGLGLQSRTAKIVLGRQEACRMRRVTLDGVGIAAGTRTDAVIGIERRHAEDKGERLEVTLLRHCRQFERHIAEIFEKFVIHRKPLSKFGCARAYKGVARRTVTKVTQEDDGTLRSRSPHGSN